MFSWVFGQYLIILINTPSSPILVCHLDMGRCHALGLSSCFCGNSLSAEIGNKADKNRKSEPKRSNH